MASLEVRYGSEMGAAASFYWSSALCHCCGGFSYGRLLCVLYEVRKMKQCENDAHIDHASVCQGVGDVVAVHEFILLTNLILQMDFDTEAAVEMVLGALRQTALRLRRKVSDSSDAGRDLMETQIRVEEGLREQLEEIRAKNTPVPKDIGSDHHSQRLPDGPAQLADGVKPVEPDGIHVVRPTERPLTQEEVNKFQ